MRADSMPEKKVLENFDRICSGRNPPALRRWNPRGVNDALFKY
jgi:hypothetical protein